VWERAPRRRGALRRRLAIRWWGGGVDLTNDDVADILALLDSLPYDSLDLRTDKFRLTLRRAPGGGWTEESELLAEPTTVTPAAPAAPAASAASASPTTSTTPASSTAPITDSPAPLTTSTTPISSTTTPASEVNSGHGTADGLVAVVAPLPGTFYRAPRPGAPPFVEVGVAVGPDTVVAIIETMKLMNSVPAGTAGRVARICVENGELAALGATLMLIEPAS